MATALVGRDTDLNMLKAFCCDASPSAASLLLTGEPGVGKTALLDTIADWAAVQGFHVLRAQAVRAEVETEFSTLNQLLLPLESWLASLAPDDQQVLSAALGFVEGSRRDSSAIAQATLAMLRLAAADRPLLLVVDDVGWADQASAQTLGLMARGLHGTRIRFLAAARAHHVGFFDRSLVPCSKVTPLEPAAATELIVRHHPQLERRELPRLLALSGGNPLALLELPRVLGAGQGVPIPQAAALLSLNRGAQSAFTADLEALPVATSRLLLMLALERTGDLNLRDAFTGRPEWLPAVQAGLVRVDSQTQRLTFRHPLIPFTVIGLATSDDRRTAHRALSELLAGCPERRAPHLAEATTRPDDGVAAELEEAAHHAARRGAAAESVALYHRSAALSEDTANRARRLVRAAYLSVGVPGGMTTAGLLLHEAGHLDHAVVSSLRYAMASSAVALHRRGDANTAHRVLVNAFGPHLARHAVDREALVEAMHLLLDVCLWSQRPEHWSSLWAVSTELRSAEGLMLRWRVATLVDPRMMPDDARELLGVGVAQRGPDDAAGQDDTSLVRIAECALHTGGLSRYRDRLEAVVADGREHGDSVAAIGALCCLAQHAYTTGEWDRARLLAAEGLAWCDRQGEQLRAWTFRWVVALVDAGRGDRRAVRHSTEEMFTWAEQHGIGKVRNYARHARALAALGRGEFEQAYQEATAVSSAAGQPSCGPETLDLARCAVESALHTYRGDEAARQVEALRTIPDDSAPSRTAPSRTTRSRPERVVAALTAMAARDDQRTPIFERALAQHEVADYPFDLARVHLAFGQHLRRARASSMARTHLRTALRIFEDLGASPWVERTKIELGATSEVRSQGVARPELTPQELTVARLAAAGQTNKQIAEKLFLTHRTVAAHLHQVFPKLGVDTRAALRDALALQVGESPAHERFLAQKPLGLRDLDRDRPSGGSRSASFLP